MVEVAHQGRPRLLAGHLARRTPHVDVDNIGPQVGGDPRALGHPAGLAARELYHPAVQLCDPDVRIARRVDRGSGVRSPPSRKPPARPSASASVRNGRSVIPDMGASMTPRADADRCEPMSRGWWVKVLRCPFIRQTMSLPFSCAD